MGRGKKFLSLFLAAAMAVTGVSVSAPVTAEAAAETRTAQEATVDLALEHFDASGAQGELSQNPSKLIISAKSGEAALKIKFSEVNNLGNGKMRIGVYETAVEEFAVSSQNDETCTTGDKAFPAVNGDYSYAATMWSNFIQQGGSEQTAVVDVTRALKNAVRNHQSSIVLRLQVPTGGGRMLGRMAADAQQVPENAPTLTVTRIAPVTVKYMAVSGDDALGELKADKIVTADVGAEYTYEVPESERIITASDGTHVVTYEYFESDPASLTVTADDGSGVAKNVITLKYKEKLADKAALQAKVNQVKINKEANYTPETWAPFKTALDAAEAVLANRYATDAEVQEALENLIAAADGLRLSEEGQKQPATDADKAAFLADIEQLVARVTGIPDYEVAYPEAARAAFDAAVERIKAKEISTLKDIEDAKAELRAAEATLKANFVTPYDGKAADVQALSDKIAEAEGLLTDENKAKDQEAYNTLKTAKEAAETAKTTALTTEVDKEFVTGATSTLDAAIQAFKAAIGVPEPGEITRVSLDQTTLSVEEGKTAKLTATIEPADATDKELTWTSDNNDIVKVESDGTETGATVTGVKAGTATITVTTKNNKTATCEVTVTSAGTIEIDGVKLNTNKLSVEEKATAQLTATIEPANATTDRTLTWTSDKKDIATVDQSGKVTGVKAGTAKITVTTKNNKTATCEVTVTPAKAAVTDVKVSLDKTAVTLAAGKDVTLKATVNPANAGSVSWTSSDAKVATVANGKVTAKKAGTAKITASVGNKSAVCTVTVISLSKTKATLGVKEKLTLKVNGTKKKVTWKTSNKKVATVKNGKITAKKANKKAINITASVDGVTLTCKLTVKAAPKKLILKGKKTITVKKNKTVKLKVSLPKNTAGALKYKTSNKKVAKVDAKGKVKGVKKGTAKITVTAVNNKKAKVVVTVKVK